MVLLEVLVNLVVQVILDRLVLVVQAETEEPLVRLELVDLLAQAVLVPAAVLVLAVLVAEPLVEL
tara:strand:- start:485 stop:679 length:195 start_codon:yes stop_codon:yes gene_type:complete